jgi:hypothetical protein
MYIKDGIAYAGEPEKMLRVESVIPTDDYSLLLTFSTGENKKFDCTPLFEYPIFQPLRDINTFKSARVAFGTVVWNDTLDYAPERLYEDSILISAC